MESKIIDNLRENLKSKLNKIKQISFATYVLFILFGIGSWTAANGILSESPILTDILPECDKLTSYIVIIVQAANIGPIFYLIVKCSLQRINSCRERMHYIDIFAIYCIFIIALVAGICLTLFWDHILIINGKSISISFLILTGVLALSDCTSTLLFIPFLAFYPESYVSALYIGEGLSGVLPSIWALIQGSTKDMLNCSEIGVIPSDIRFGPNIFFLAPIMITFISLLAFTGILLFPFSRKEKQKVSNDYFNPSSVLYNQETTDDPSQPLQFDSLSCETSSSVANSIPVAKIKPTSDCTPSHHFSSNHEYSHYIWLSILLLFEIIVCALSNSFIYSVMPYFTIPYSQQTFLWCLNLTLISQPIGSLIGGFQSSNSSKKHIVAATAVYSLLAVWLIFVAGRSPHVPISSTADILIIGKIHIVLLSSISGLLAGFIKVGIGIQARYMGSSRYLLFVGIFTQIGSLIGGIISFVLINITNSFRI